MTKPLFDKSMLLIQIDSKNKLLIKFLESQKNYVTLKALSVDRVRKIYSSSLLIQTDILVDVKTKDVAFDSLFGKYTTIIKHFHSSQSRKKSHVSPDEIRQL